MSIAADLTTESQHGLGMAPPGPRRRASAEGSDHGPMSTTTVIPLTVMDYREPGLVGALMAAVLRVASAGACTGGAAVAESPRYRHRVVGATGRLGVVQAPLLCLKLSRLDRLNQVRGSAAYRLRDVLADASPPVILYAPAASDGDHVYHQFVVPTPQRDTVKDLLARWGIATGIRYPIPIHLSEAYDALNKGVDAPCATKLAPGTLSQPMCPSLTGEQIERIGDALRECSIHIRDAVIAPSPLRTEAGRPLRAVDAQ
jgi:dTDP-4-amino-4,6-dideoxygalactose transaminase